MHASFFPKKFICFTTVLEEAGYHVGYTGKGWGPGDFRTSGRKQNPAGKSWNKRKNKVPAKGINRCDYAANFQDFLAARKTDQPFCFWYGASEPHRAYEFMSGAKKASKKIADVKIPPFLPDNETIRHDILDFAFEVDWFDTHLGRMIKMLEDAGELDNTIIIVTSDNGMPFPRAKANLYEYGTHLPLAICWGDKFKPSKIKTPVSLIEIAPTILEAAGLEAPSSMLSSSLMPLLQGKAHERPPVLTGRERHTHARVNNWTYPCRAIRTEKFLLIRNFKSGRWPAGDPQGYHDIDNCPAKTEVLKIKSFAELSVGKRPELELYDIGKDPHCMKNLAETPEYEGKCEELLNQLNARLKKDGDPRLNGYGDIFESYPRISHMRPQLGGFAQRAKYNPDYLQKNQQVPQKLIGEKKK